MVVIGIDIGTTSICVLSYDTEKREIIRSRNLANDFIADSFCQNPDKIINDTINLLETIIQETNCAIQGKTYAEILSQALGLEVYSGCGSITHFALGEKNKVPPTARGIANIGDYLIMKLCGKKKAVMHESIAASMGGFDIAEGTFLFEKLSASGIDTTFYPDVIREFKSHPFFIWISWNGKQLWSHAEYNRAKFSYR